MRIEQLEYVAAVARMGSYRKAAESLHISQPALSESVRSLERELGVDLLERGRYGATLSRSGRDLLPHMLPILDGVDRLRRAAGERHQMSRVVRVGTVNAATVPLLAPAIRKFREVHSSTQVEVFSGLQDDIHRGLREGSTDLGLVNYLEGDDTPPELETIQLLSGPPVVCLRPDSELAAKSQITVADLRAAPLIVMRRGYVMHRYLHRLLGGEPPVFPCTTEGAEMGKLMVAEGLGVTLLPAFSVIGDPLEKRGAITWRPLAGDTTPVKLVLQRLRSSEHPRAVRDLQRILVQCARKAPGAPGTSLLWEPGFRTDPKCTSGRLQEGRRCRRRASEVLLRQEDEEDDKDRCRCRCQRGGRHRQDDGLGLRGRCHRAARLRAYRYPAAAGDRTRTGSILVIRSFAAYRYFRYSIRACWPGDRLSRADGRYRLQVSKEYLDR